VLRAVDKYDRLGVEGVRQLLGPGREDESGDFTKGAALGDEQAEFVLNVITNQRLAEGANELEWDAKAQTVESYKAGFDELDAIRDLVSVAGYDGRIQIDPSVVRGLEYYTGPVFEAQLLFEVPNEKGQPVIFGSVGGGGRYDGLVGRFRGEDVPATGFSVGVSRLAAALKAVGKLGDESASGPVVVTVMDRDRVTDYQRMVADLRNAGVAAEMYLGSSGMKAQLKYADRRNAPAAIIAGSQEFESGKLQVKDLVAGKEQAAKIEGHDTWREERPGQFEIAARDLVAEVMKLLEKQRSA
jgi:histidyl-tRNA synthetase